MTPEPVEYPIPDHFSWHDPEFLPPTADEARAFCAWRSDWYAADLERLERESRARQWEIRELIAELEIKQSQGSWWDQQCRAAQFMREREDDELNDMLIGNATDTFVRKTLWDRVERYNTARQLLTELGNASYLVELRHGAVRVYPDPPAALAARVHDLQPELGDILDAVEETGIAVQES
jgi:hypothetical protein